MNILIVDDVPLNRKLLRVILESKEFKTFEVGNGLEAMALLEREKIDLIISDLLMPEMDGYRLCYEVRNSPKFKDIPLILFSATFTSLEDEKLSIEFGADKYIKKPVPTEVLIREIYQAIEHRKQHKTTVSKPNKEVEIMKEYSERLVSKLKEKSEAMELVLEKFKQSEEKYRTLAEAAKDDIFIIDRNGKLEYINQCGAQKFGLSPQNIIGKKMALLFPPEIVKENLLELHHVFNSGQSFYEERELQFGTKKIWMGTRITPIRSDSGEINSVLGIARDIMDRKQAEGDILKFKLGIEHSNDIIFITDIQGNFTYTNPTFEKFYGYTQEEVLGKTPRILKSGLHSSEHYKQFWDTLLSKQEFKGELVNKTKEGKRVDIEVTVNPILGSSGNILGYMAIQRDITERKKAEIQLRESENKYRRLVENVPATIFLKDLNSVYISINNKYAKDLGILPEEVVGKTDFDFFPKEYAEKYRADDKKIMESGETVNLVEEYMDKGGKRWINTTKTPIQNEQGKTIGILGILVDITKHKQVEEENLFTTSLLNAQSETSIDGILVVSKEGKTLLTNKRFGEIWNIPQEILDTRDDKKMLHYVVIQLKDPDGFIQKVKHLYEHLNEESFDEIEFKGGKVLERYSPPLLSSKGSYYGRIWFFRDITERKLAEKTREILAALGKQLSEVSTPIEVAKVIVTSADKLFGWDACAIELYHENGKRGEALITIDTIEGQRKEFPSLFTGDALPTMNQRVLKEGPILILREETEIEKGMDLIAFGNTTRKSASLMYVPIRKQKGIIGFLTIQSYTPNVYTQKDLKLLQSLSDYCGGALDRTFAELGKQTQLQHISALHDIDMAIANSLDLRVTLSVILNQVKQQLHVDAVDILLMNSHTHYLEFGAEQGFRTHSIHQTQLRLGDEYAGRAALEHRNIIIPDLKKEEKKVAIPLFRKEGFIAYCAIPLIAKKEIKGVLEIYHRSPLVTSSEWLDYLNVLAGQAAIAIDNSVLFNNLQSSNSELIRAYDTTIEGWSAALDLRDKETEGHTQRVTELTLQLARDMNINALEMVHIRRGGLLHDIGKMGVPDNILSKPGKLTDEEWVIMKKHPVFAYELLKNITYLHKALDIPYCHHEKWDGTGYPRGLKGEEIPLTARIFAIIDVWDALRSDRPYRKAWPVDKTLEHIKSGSGTHFDPTVVEAFLHLESINSLK